MNNPPAPQLLSDDNQQESVITNPQPVFENNNLRPDIPKKSRKKMILIICLVAVILALILIAGVYIFAHGQKKTPKSITTSQEAKPNISTSNLSSALFTYLSQDGSNLIVTDINQKVLAKINQTGSDNYLDVLKSNGQDILVADASNGGTSSPIYLINSQGLVTKLPSSVASSIIANNSSNYSMYLGYSNNYFETYCPATGQESADYSTCSIKNINLLTDSSQVITTVKNTSSYKGLPLDVLGIAPNNIIYALNYAKGNTTTFEEIEMKSQKVVKSTPLPDVSYMPDDSPSASKDFKNIAYFGYTPGPGQTEVDITNIATGKTSKIDDQCSPQASVSFAWSYDSSKLAYTCSGDINSVSFVASIDIGSSKVTKLKVYPADSTSLIVLEGWLTNNAIAYNYQAVVNNIADNTFTYNSVDVDSGNVTINPSPAGYHLVTDRAGD